MKVIKTGEVKAQESTSAIFRGKVHTQSLIDEKIARELQIRVVSFTPGARTVLHTHTNEQVLYVTDGEGILATEKEEHVVTPGTIIFIPSGELHWHGATSNTSFTHISITTPGETKF